MADTVVERLLDFAGDILIAVRGIVHELDRWNAAPRYGFIYVGGQRSMATADIIDIPDNDIPVRVDWLDRLRGQVSRDKTDTTWRVVDENEADTDVVSVQPDTSDSDEETGTVTFSQPQGRFQLIATTPGPNGEDIEARSALYNITPGAPAVGEIVLTPSA